jgi:hypothetical protein
MKSPPQNWTAHAPRRSYHIRPSNRRQLPPHPPYRDRRTPTPDFDSACWLETAGGAAIAIQTFADHREDADQ